jgi:hypothetical protein
MSRKDYIAFARLVLAQLERGDLNGAVDAAHGMADVFAGDNPAFDRGRFLVACGLAS